MTNDGSKNFKDEIIEYIPDRSGIKLEINNSKIKTKIFKCLKFKGKHL